MKKFIINLVSLLFLLLIGYFLFVTFIYLKDLFSNVQKEVLASIIATSGTLFIAILSIYLTKYFDRKSRIEQEIRDKKIPVYNEFIDFLFKLLNFGGNKQAKVEDVEIQEFMKEFTKKMIIWGSDEFIEEWYKFKTSGIDPASSTAESLESVRKIERIFYAIRKDIGHKNRNLKQDMILNLFINDLENYKKRTKH